MNHKYKSGAYVILQFNGVTAFGYIHRFSHICHVTKESPLSPAVYVMTYKRPNKPVEHEKNLNAMYIVSQCKFR